jgi:hypothetical protein|nr:MAG TPA: hypothetical protein [Caudoviricetes sp.]
MMQLVEEISDDAQQEFIIETFDSLYTVLRIKQTVLHCQFDNTEHADAAFELIRGLLSDIKYSIFGLHIDPCKKVRR